MTNRIKCYLGIWLVVCSPMLSATTKYVTDDLQLALHEESDSKGKLLQRLPSGTRLEILEEDGFFAKVRTPDGTVGWTKSGFLMTEKPARARVIELEQQQEKLTKALEVTQQKLDANKQLTAELRAEKIQTALELADERENKQGESDLLNRLQVENRELKLQLKPQQELQIPLRWGLIGAALSLLLGLIGGIALFDWISRRRHGGYRIY